MSSSEQNVKFWFLARKFKLFEPFEKSILGTNFSWLKSSGNNTVKVQVWNSILNISITFFLLSEGTWPWPALTTSIPAIVAALAPWFSPFGSFPLRSVWLPFSDGRMQDTRTGSMSSNSVLSAKMWDTRFLPLWWPFMPLWSSFCSFIGGFLWRLEHVCGKEWRQKLILIYIR